MKKILGVVAMLVLTAGAAVAQVQAGKGALAGVVEDKSHAAIPGATVTLDNPGIGLHLVTKTNKSGEYAFSPLEVVGGYTIHVEAKGFATEDIENIATSVGTIITQNALLAVGKQDTVVEVEGAAVEQVQTDTSAVSELVDSTIWKNSPLEDRNQNDFVGLVAGAAGSYAGRGYAVNGARSGTGNFEVDGFDNNDQGLGGGATGGAVTTISPDAIEEFRVITSVPNAEYGRAGGFATDTVLKSGTKTWHGSAFEYNRIQAITANNWFSDQQGLRDHLVKNQFGGSIGGPVYKDKTFFYATTEFERRSTGSPATFIGTTQAFVNFVQSGAYEQFMEGTANQSTAADPEDPNSGLTQQGFCPVYLGRTCPGAFSDTRTLGATFTKNYASNPTTFPYGNSFLSNEPTDLFGDGAYYLPVDLYAQGSVISSAKYAENRGTMKLDHKLTTRDQLSFSYLADLDNTTSNDGGGNYTFPGPAETSVGGAQLFGADWVHTFTPNIVNDFKAGYLRHKNNIAAVNVAQEAEFFNADSLYTGFGGYSGLPQFFTENQFTYEDSLTYTHGNHTMKYGFDYKRTRNGSYFFNDVYGTVGFWGTPGMLTDGYFEQDAEALVPGFASYGALYYASASLDPTTLTAPDPYRGYRANEFSAYAQDDWKVTSRLVFNYGVRWDYFGPPHNFKAGYDSNVFFGTATTPAASTNPFVPQNSLLAGEQGASFQLIGTNGRTSLWNKDTNNFAPRLGFAYDTMGNGKFVIRGGFGIGYDRLYNNVYENIRFNGPKFVDNAYGFGAGTGTLTPALRAALVQTPFVGNVPLSVAGAGPVPRHVNQHLVTAYYEQAHLGVETQFYKGYVLEANYIGTFGRKLVGIENINTYQGRNACYSGSSTAQKALCRAAGYTTFSNARPTSAFGNDNFRTNAFNSNYNGGQVSLRKGYANGLQLLLNYTYSKGLDEVSDVFTIKTGGTGITNPYDPGADYGPSDNDVRHLAAFTVNYETHSAAHKLLLGGWAISPIIKMQSGTPIYIKDGNGSYDPNKDGTTGIEKAVYIGTGSIKNAINHGVSPAHGYLKHGSFGPYTCPTTKNAGLFCEVPGDRQSLYGPRYYNMDVSVSKHLYFARYSFTLQAAFFDVDNHPEFGNPVGDINSSSFGLSQSSFNRIGQLSARFDF